MKANRNNRKMNYETPMYHDHKKDIYFTANTFNVMMSSLGFCYVDARFILNRNQITLYN